MAQGDEGSFLIILPTFSLLVGGSAGPKIVVMVSYYGAGHTSAIQNWLERNKEGVQCTVYSN